METYDSTLHESIPSLLSPDGVRLAGGAGPGQVSVELMVVVRAAMIDIAALRLCLSDHSGPTRSLWGRKAAVAAAEVFCSLIHERLERSAAGETRR